MPTNVPYTRVCNPWKCIRLAMFEETYQRWSLQSKIDDHVCQLLQAEHGPLPKGIMNTAKDQRLLIAYAAFNEQDGGDVLLGCRIALLVDGAGRTGITAKSLYFIECSVLDGDRNDLNFQHLLLELEHLPFVQSSRPAPTFLTRGTSLGPYAEYAQSHWSYKVVMEWDQRVDKVRIMPLAWDWYDEETDCFIIPSETKGLKRRKGVTDSIITFL